LQHCNAYVQRRREVNVSMLLLAEGEVYDQQDTWRRFAAITYNNNTGQFVYSARRWYDGISSYICEQQLQGLYQRWLMVKMVIIKKTARR